MIPFAIAAMLLAFQVSPAVGQAPCVSEGSPSPIGGKTMRNTCKNAVTIRYWDDFSCRNDSDRCTVTIPAGRSAVISTPAGQRNMWKACWGRKIPRFGAGGVVLCD